jgi:hypothetical protein
VGLEGFENSYPHELSGGMKQKGAIVRALVNNPKALFMDEPFAALDPVNRVISIEELQAIHARLGLTIILVTHRPDEAELLGTHVAVVVEGRLAAFGDAPAVFATPPDERVVRALGLENLLPAGCLAGLPGPGPWYVPASSVRIQAGSSGPVPGERLVLAGVVDLVQRTGPLARIRIRGDGYHITGYPDGDIPGIAAQARALLDPAAVRALAPAEPAPAGVRRPPQGLSGRIPGRA